MTQIVNPGGLNDDQMRGVARIQAFLNSASTVFTLTGGPGTGKTYMLSYLLRLLNKQKVCFAAPSHAAKSVLEQNLKNANIKATVLTVASVLGVKPISNEERVFKATQSQKSLDIDLLIVDECSMISDEYYKLLIDFAEYKQIKIIAVGDRDQLPPVEQQDDSLFFNHIGCELKIVQRFGKNIKALSDIYKDAINALRNEEPISPHILNIKTERTSVIAKNKEDGTYIFTNDARYCVETAAKIVTDSGFKGTACRLLAFKNETVNLLNSKMRKFIFQMNEEDLKMYEDNETVICNGGLKEAGLFNGQVLTIESSETVIHPVYLSLICQKVKLKGISQEVFVIDKNHLKVFSEERNKLYEVCKYENRWRDYWDFVDSFAVLDYGYAQNIYKCQGSTIDNVFIFEDEIMSVKPIPLKAKFKSLYVAVTRVRDTVYIYNQNY